MAHVISENNPVFPVLWSGEQQAGVTRSRGETLRALREQALEHDVVRLRYELVGLILLGGIGLGFPRS